MEEAFDLSDWETIVQFLPENWDNIAKEMGVLERKRKIKSAEELLHLTLFHLVNGLSMRSAVSVAEMGGLPKISDVAFLKKFKKTADWFSWMTKALFKERGYEFKPPDCFEKYNPKCIDATDITEPGSKGKTWSLHYCYDLYGFKCDEFLLSRQKVGESFLNFKVKPYDLFIADRVYSRFKGLKYVNDNGGFFLTRYMNKAFKIYQNDGKEFELMQELKKLRIGQILDSDVELRVGTGDKMTVRICAVRLPKNKAEESVRRAVYEQKKKQRKINTETIDFHRFIIVLTNLDRKIRSDKILEIYRLRWQIELRFKEYKSIFDMGYVPKNDAESARSWIQGKLFITALINIMIDADQSFSPWGYPLRLQ